MASYLTLELRGDGRERGAAYGRAAREDILENIKTYQKRFARGGLSWEDARKRSLAFLPAIAAFAPDLLLELESIAASSRVDMDDLLVLNARTSLTYNLSDDCTSVALVCSRNARCEILGQNWDNMVRLRPVLLRVTAPDAPTVMTLTEAGTLAKIGFNDAGIGVCVNGLGRPGDPAEGSIPIFVFLRRLLGTRSLDAAKDLVLSCRRDAPHNFLIGARDGGAIDIESLYADAEIVPGQAEGVAHTNHLLAERFRALDAGKPIQNSALRLQRAADLLLEGQRAARTPERLLSLLSDHANGPDAICRHRPTIEGGFQIITKHAVVMDFRSPKMSISDGPPCKSPIHTYRLDETLVDGQTSR